MKVKVVLASETWKNPHVLILKSWLHAIMLLLPSKFYWNICAGARWTRAPNEARRHRCVPDLRYRNLAEAVWMKSSVRAAWALLRFLDRVDL